MVFIQILVSLYAFEFVWKEKHVVNRWQKLVMCETVY